MNKREIPLWSGAIVGLAVVLALHTSAHSQVQEAPGLVGQTGQLNIGSEDSPPPPSEVEPDFPECWFFPGLPWCHHPKIAPPPDPEPVPCPIDRPCGSEDKCCTPYDN